jgi:hypothetical protein
MAGARPWPSIRDWVPWRTRAWIGVLTVLIIIWVRGYWTCDSFRYVWLSRTRDVAHVSDLVLGQGNATWIQRQMTTKDWEYSQFVRDDCHLTWDRESARNFPEGVDAPGLIEWVPQRERTIASRIGFYWFRATNAAPSEYVTAPVPLAAYWTRVWAVTVPAWLIALVVAVYPARLAYLAARAWTRYRRGRCTNCGYDLRVSRVHCPECGAPVCSKSLAP